MFKNMTIAYYKNRIKDLSTKSRFCLTSRKQLEQLKKEFETLKKIKMANMSYCRYENTANDLKDVVDALHNSDCGETISEYEQQGLYDILDLAYEVIGLADKIENIIENQDDNYNKNRLLENIDEKIR